MSGRQAHGRPVVPGRAYSAKNKSKSKSRSKPNAQARKTTQNAQAVSRSRDNAQNAFTLASEQVADGGQGGRKRDLDPDYEMDAEMDERRRKKQFRPRHNDGDDEGSDDDGDSRPTRRSQDDDEEDDYGSDVMYISDDDGKRIKVRLDGRNSADDDSEIDSDYAFCSSDEDEFQDFTFRASKHFKRDQENPVNLEDENYDSLGEDAVDLATALDMADQESSDDETMQRNDSSDASDSEANSEEESESGTESDDEDDSGNSDSDSEEESFDKKQSLRSLASQFSGAAPSASASASTSGNKISLHDLGLGAVQDPLLRKSAKLLLQDEPQASSEALPSTSTSKKLNVPLPQRQQEQISRSSAFETTAKTLSRWTETVKHFRRAEHLSFPLAQQTHDVSQDNVEFQPIQRENAVAALETTMMDILEASGMPLDKKQKPTDQNLGSDDEIDESSLTPEQRRELWARRRREREFQSREEARNKRIKKIKSKTYHKIHRKQQERDAIALREQQEENGELNSEDERLEADRRRALERMGSRHRESKWAKKGTQNKRAVWDDDYRSGLTDMMRREDELRRRIEKRQSGRAGGDDDEDSSSGEEDYGEFDFNGDDAQVQARRKAKLLRKLEALEKETHDSEDEDEGNSKHSKLFNLSFMKKAEETRKRANDEMIAQIRKDLTAPLGSDYDTDTPEDNTDLSLGTGTVGRQSFGGGANTANPDDILVSAKASQDRLANISLDAIQQKSATKPRSSKAKKSESNEDEDTSSDSDESDDEVDFILEESKADSNPWIQAGERQPQRKSSKQSKSTPSSKVVLDLEEADKPFALTKASSKSSSKKSKSDQKSKQPEPEDDDTSSSAPSSSDSDSDSDSEAESDAPSRHPLALREEDKDLIARAFAGGDVVEAEFAREKEEAIREQDDQVIDNTLPGWGSWIGEGVSQRARKPKSLSSAKNGLVKTVKGVGKDERRDAKLDRVIINEKRVLKNDKYLVDRLPHQYESPEQYERALRMAVGEEWMTKESFQDSTKPRVTIRQGIIAPISKPIL